MSRRQRRTKQRRRRHNPAAPSRRVRTATISGSIAATAAIGLAAGAGPADAASFDAVKVKDVNVDTGHGTQFTEMGGTLFFVADDGTHGEELWKSDGTDAGTTMVTDINTGNSGADGSYPQYLTVVGDTLFFSATDGDDNGTTQHGKELWRSDGTVPGTYRVKDINMNSACSYGVTGDSSPRGLANVGGTLFFRACDGSQGGGTHGIEPWTSDGTSLGTTLVQDINTNAASHAGNSSPGIFTDVAGDVFFSATDGNDDGTPGQHGYELWKSDSPDFNSATMVQNINGAGSSFPGGLTDIGGTLLFAASDGGTGGNNGRELWKSTDPFSSATLLEDINVGAGDSSPYSLIDFGGTLVFAANDGTNGYELWKSVPPFDGTDSHTTMVKNINTGSAEPTNYPGGSLIYPITELGGTLFFGAYDGPQGGGTHGEELWRSDGTGAGTTLVKDINPSGSHDPYYYDGPYNLTPAGGSLFFSAHDASGRELWSSDGTEAGTELVQDINPGGGSSYPYHLTDVNGTLFFAADDGNGYDLWKVIPAAPAGPAAPVSNQFSVAGKKGNKKKGTVQYTFNLPGGGVLNESQAGTLSAEAVAAKGGTVVKPGSVTASQAGPVTITIKPTKRGKSILADKGKLRVSVKFTFTPTGGSPSSQTLKVLLKLA